MKNTTIEKSTAPFVELSELHRMFLDVSAIQRTRQILAMGKTGVNQANKATNSIQLVCNTLIQVELKKKESKKSRLFSDVFFLPTKNKW